MDERSESVVQATRDLHKAKQAWEEMLARLAELEAKGVHTSDAEEDEILRLERRLEAYPEYLDGLQRAEVMAFDTTRIDQVTAAAPAKIQDVVDDHHDLHHWMQDGVAIARRYKSHRRELEQLLVLLPKELHEYVKIEAQNEVVRKLPALLQALLDEAPGWRLETTLEADKATRALPSNLYERYHEQIDLRLRRDAALRAQAEESDVAWVTVYEARTGRPVPMRPTDAAEALALGHHQAEPPAWVTAREDTR